jgi:hypothetical protein
MQTHEIAPPQWKNVFDSLSRIYDGARATLEVIGPDIGAQIEVENRPLRGISYDQSGLELHFDVAGSHLVHRIPTPKRVQIEEGDSGLVQAVEIEAEDEPVVILRFDAPVASELLPRAGN